MPRHVSSLRRRQVRRGTVCLALLAAGLAALAARVVYIQAALGEEMVGRARRQQAGWNVLPARRGMILDRKGRVMAASRQRPDLFVDPALLRDEDELDELAIQVEMAVGVPAEDVVAAVEARPGSRFVVLKRCLEPADVAEVRRLGQSALGLADHGERTYPLAGTLAHVLGFVGRDGHGLEGLERRFDEHLAGADGQRATIRDAARRPIWRDAGGMKPPVDGGHVVLTIDAEVQRVATLHLREAIDAFEGESGLAVVMVPRTGEVLALTCWPTFDPADPSAGPEANRRNRAITDPTEAGSTFKPFVAAAALAGRCVSRDEKIDCEQGVLHLPGRTVRDVHGYGEMTLQGIICKSSNVGMSKVAERVPEALLYETLRGFGFGAQTGLELPGEAEGLVYPVSRWTRMSKTSLAMGYEVSITPMQLVMAYGALANDGVLMRPRLVKQLLGPDGSVVASFEQSEPVRRVVSSEIARYLAKEVLVSVVEEGSGRDVQLAEYQVLGKTGTAKLPYRDRTGYEPGAYLSSFVGAAPASDPQVVALVMVRRPRASLGYYGGKVAGPAVRDILADTLSYLEVPPDCDTRLAEQERDRL